MSDEKGDPLVSLQRSASAALSVMYLASMPGLRDQVKAAPGVIESLARRVLTVDLDLAKQVVMHQQAAMQRSQQQGQDQQQRAAGAAPPPELVSVGLLALAKLAAPDTALQGWLLGGSGRGAGAGVARARLAEGLVLSRVDEVMRSGVPSWQAAAAVLLHSLAGPGTGQRSVRAWVAARTEGLIDVGMGLLETGAFMNSTDALSSGAQLLELVAAGPAGRQQLVASGVQPVILQVLLTYTGTNGTSAAVGNAVRLLRQLMAPSASGSGSTGDAAGQAAAAELMHNVTHAGLVAPLVREVRLGNRASLAPALVLLLDIMRAAPAPDSGTNNDSDSGGSGTANDSAHEAVGTGLLSLCAQLLFQADGSSDPDALVACSEIVRHTLRNCKDANRPAPRRMDLDGEEAAAEQSEGAGKATHEGASASGKQQQQQQQQQPGGAYTNTAQARQQLAADLLQMMRDTTFPDLHNAVLEACRDVAPSRVAAEALVAAGAVPQVAHILMHNVSQSHEQGVDPGSTAWIVQSQRSAAALVALLALQPPLRQQVVEQGGLKGLAAALMLNSGHPGLMAQVRVTAAAALVPLLGEDGRYLELAVHLGVLEPLVKMYFATSEQERRAAGRVLTLLGQDTSVAAMFERVGIKV
eukprot:XP_001694732.1 predicted protein [Chlamydomonas reinhardtii]